MTSIKKIYSNPPIVEAVCEFRFKAVEDKNLKLADILYSSIKDVFPVKDTIKYNNVQFKLDESGITSEHKVTAERSKFLTEDGNQFVQADDDLLAVNVLRPYSKWEDFSAKAIKAYDAFQKAYENKRSLERIGLRYINIIEIPRAEFEFNEYFRIFNTSGIEIIDETQVKSRRHELVLEDSHFQIKFSIGDLQNSNLQIAYFVVDIDVLITDFENIENSLNDAHDKISNIFENVITEKTRKLFE